MPPVVVADTNILVRALTGGPGSSVTLQLWQSGQIQLTFCAETLSELADVLNRPHLRRYFTLDNALRLLTLLRQNGTWIKSIRDNAWCRDPKDDVFINLAIAANARFIVSADLDLIDDDQLKARLLSEHQIQIIREADLLTALPHE